MARSHQILAVGGDPALLARVRARLIERGHEVETFDSASACTARFSSEGADLVLVCLPLRAGGGADVVRRLRDADPRISVLVTGRDAQIPGAAEAFAVDAFEWLEDPEREMHDMLAAVGSALGSRRGDVQLRYLKEREAVGSRWESVVGQSPEMQEVIGILRRVAERTTRGAAPTILLRGETGTGKGLIAKCVHYDGVRRNQPFVEINCAAIPATMLESELFGHERGAFTDAKASRAGLFETAHRGTLFLDEIANLSFDLQAKLLTAIEEKKIRRLGARQSSLVDVQIIAASHDDLSERVRTGAFRADLYHRLNVVSVVIPPLRRRGLDKLVLAESFLQAMCREYGTPLRVFGPEAKAYVLEHTWPGNVRELRNQIERLVLLGNDEIILREDFDRPSTPPPPSAKPAPSRRASGTFSLVLPEEGIGLDEVECELIRRALDRCAGNVSQTARYLKVSRQTLMYRIKRHGLGR